jgi:hypothetical protein
MVGHLETATGGKTYRLCHTQSVTKPLYIQHLKEIFHDIIPPKGQVHRVYPTGKVTQGFRTRYSTLFTTYGQAFYRDGKKVLPLSIEKWLTPCALSFWYMNDGSMKSKQSKGVFLNTQCFSRREIELLCTLLTHKYNLLCWPRKLKKKQSGQIYISGRSYHTLSHLITPYFREDMWYKFPPPRTGEKVTHLPKE